MNQELQKALELIEKSERISLALPPEPTFDNLAAAEVLVRFLEERGKHTGIFAKPQIDEGDADTLKRVVDLPPLPREFIVSLDSSKGPISQLRYEKGDDRINIIFSPKSAPLSEEHISFSQGKVFCDILITLGVPEIESLNGSLGVEPEFFVEKPILNIDNSEENKKYGETNFLHAGSSLCEMVYRLVSSVGAEALDEEQATLLLAGITEYSRGFSKKDLSPDSLLAASELMRLGGSWEKAQKRSQKSYTLSLMQLFGRASVRSKEDKEGGVLWSFLTADDFEKTSRGVKDLPLVTDYLARSFPSRGLSILLWQDPKGKTVRSVISGRKDLLNKISVLESGKFQSPHFAPDREFSSFLEAEENLSSLLRGVL